MRRFLVPLALLFIPVAPAADQATSLAGKWKITLRTFVEVYSLTADINQDGNQISGTVCGNVRCYPITGVVSDRKVEVRAQLEFWRNVLTVILTGVLDGNRISGRGDCAGFPCDWTGERIVPLPSEATADRKQASTPRTALTGEWRLGVKTDDAISYPVFYFSQRDDMLTGTCRTSFGETRVTGTVRGRQVRFSVRVARWDGDVTIAYTGIVDGNAMSGSVRLGEIGWGTWSAQRRE